MAASRQVVLSFEGDADATKTPRIRGGKGAGLVLLADLGLPVSPFFTLSTSVSRAFAENDTLPRRTYGQIERGIALLEKATGYTFGDPENPLLVSVRSGAEQSMPGMMDTILNVGIDPTDLSGLCRWGGKRFAHNTRDRFLKQWPTFQPSSWAERSWSELSGQLPAPKPVATAKEQLMLAIEAVLRSWNSERAQAYRKAQNIPNYLGTAVTVQAMVFGNVGHDSCTGVVFSANTSTGEEGLFGEFLTRAQGEDVVSGTSTPRPIAEMEAWNPQVYQQLEAYVLRLAAHFGTVVDVEFTVQKGELFILQVRKAKLTTVAKVTQAVHDVWAKRRTKQAVLATVSIEEVRQLQHDRFAEGEAVVVLGKGLPVSPGAAVGLVATTSREAVHLANAGFFVILVRPDTSPDDMPGMLKAAAIVTATGGTTCHAAVVARELGLPAVVGVKDLLWNQLHAGRQVSVDGALGVIADGEVPLQEAQPTKEVNIFLKWFNQTTAYQPRLGFEWIDKKLCANQLLSDFYLIEMMAQRSQGSPLGSQIASLRLQIHRKVAESFAMYLAMACTGEVRHFWKHGHSQRAMSPMQVVSKVIDTSAYGSGSLPARIQRDIVPKLQVLSHAALLEYFKAIWLVFKEGSWGKGFDTAYGGPKWAAIAKALHDFLAGSLTPVLFVDHVFDLRHNGGRLFNKHAMFANRTVEGGESYGLLYEQLEAKKGITNLRMLFDHLTAEPAGHPSPEVLAVWGVGKRQNLW